MADPFAFVMFMIPMMAVVIALGWCEVARIRGLKEIALAAIEAETRVRVAKAQAAAPTDAGEEGEGDGNG